MKPWLKLLGLLALTGWIIAQSRWEILLIPVLICLIILRRRPNLSPRIKFLFWPLVLMLAVQLFLGNWQTAIIAWLKLAGLSLTVLIYTSFTPAAELVRVFGRFGTKSQLLITLTLNFLPLILKELAMVRLVQKTRGAGCFNPLPLIIPVFHRTLRRAEQLALVLSLSATGEI